MNSLPLLKFAMTHHVTPGLAALSGLVPGIGPSTEVGLEGDSIQGAARAGGRSYLEAILGTILGGAAGHYGGRGLGKLMALRNPNNLRALNIGRAMKPVINESEALPGAMSALGGVLGAGTGMLGGSMHGAYAAAQNFNNRNTPPPDFIHRLLHSLGH